MAYHRQQGVDTAIVRIFNTYGPRMRAHDGRAIPTFLRQALQDQPLTVFGDGSQTRSFCYVDDLIRGIVGLAESDEHSPVNIGNPNEFTLLELAKAVIEVTGSSSEIVYEALPTDDPQQRRPDIGRAQRAARLGADGRADRRPAPDDRRRPASSASSAKPPSPSCAGSAGLEHRGDDDDLLLIGAGGFVGTHLRRAAAAAGLRVIAATRAGHRRGAALRPARPRRRWRPACRRSSRTCRQRRRRGLGRAQLGAPGRDLRGQRHRRPQPARGRRRRRPRRPRPLPLLGRRLRRARGGELPLGEELQPRPGHPLRGQQGGDGGALRPVRPRPRAADRRRPRLQPDRPRPVAAVHAAPASPATSPRPSGPAEAVELALGNPAAAPRLRSTSATRARALLELSRRRAHRHLQPLLGRGPTIAELVEELTARRGCR